MLRAIHVRLYVNFMKARGHDPEAVLSGSGIREPQLSEPQYLVDASQCHAVASNMLNLHGPRGLGLEIGASMKLSDLGIVGYAMASSGTLGQAITIWMQYGIAAVGAPFSLTPVTPRANGTWGVTASAHGYSQSLMRFYFEEALGMGSNFGELLTGKPFTFREITCAYPAPPYWREYEKRLGCKPAFNAKATRALVQQRIDKVNAQLASYETIKKFALMPQPLTVEGGLLTPTLKVKRKKVYEAFKDDLEALYAG